jgi:hypothetical protein
MLCVENHRVETAGAAPEAEPTLSVVAAYEDFAAGKRAMQIYNRLLHQFVHEYKFKINLWKFDFLHTPKLLKMAVAEAAEADVVFVSAHADGALSEEVKTWLRRWVSRKKNSSTTLVALLEGKDASTIEGSAIRASLRRVAEKAGINFYCHGSVRTKKRGAAIVETISEKCTCRSSAEEEEMEEVLPEHAWFPC